MSNAERRQNICHQCILVKGFRNETNFNVIRGIFQGAIRGEVVARTSSFEHSQREWIIYFSSPNDIQGYIEERVRKSPEGILEISTCELPCDIPDEWLQEPDVHNVPQEPPLYSDIYPNQQQHGGAPPTHSTGSRPGFQLHYDPIYFPQFMPHPGQNSQNPNQQLFVPLQWPQQGPSTGNDGKGAQGPCPPEYLQGQDGIYYPYPPYGYPGYLPYGYPGYEDQQPQGQSQPPQQSPGYSQQFSGQRIQSPRETTKASEDVTKRSTDDENTSETDEAEEEEAEEEPKKTTTNMLKVTKLPLGTTEDSLVLFFENTRRYGGGDVKEIDYDEETLTAIITFKDDDAVVRVLQKMPILLGKQIIEVEAYTANVEPPLDITGDKVYDCTEDPHEQETTRTIEVQGMKSSTTEDTIWYFFESRKGANADVETIEFDEENNRYLITFEEEEAVDRVLKKSHVVDGATLQVKKYVPEKRYPNKVLVKGLREKTSKDDVINFLETRTNKDVETVDFGDEDSQKAIVTFSEPVDVNEIQTICKKKALKGNTLTIHPVVVTNCIIVRGYSERTTESSLECYFDNKRKSGVEGVTEIIMNTDEDYCLVYFEDSNDALVACQRSHTVDKCTLQVQVFYDCLGIPAGDEGPKFKPLAPIVVDNLEPRKIRFLLHSRQSKTDIEQRLSNLHGRIILPEKGDESHLKIECTLTKDTKDCCKLAKSWGEDVKKMTLTFMDGLAYEKHAPLQTAFHQVVQKLRDINIPNPDGVCVSIEKGLLCEIYIVGQQSAVKEVSDMVKTITDEVTEELNRKKQQIQEEVSLKHHQLLILALTHFPDTIKGTFDNMEVNIDMKRLVITFDGISGDVTSAKVKMIETLNNIVSANIGKKSYNFFRFLKSPDVKAHIGKKIKDKGLVGVWDIHGSSVVMYSISDEDVVDAANIFKEAIFETKVDIDKLRQSSLQSAKWNQFVKSIEDESQQKSVITKLFIDRKGQIILLCTDKGESSLIRERIQMFFVTNTENKITINLPAPLLKFLQEHMKDEIDRLESQLKQKNVIIAVKSDEILVKGNKQGITDAQDEIDTLVKTINKTTHSTDKPGISELMETSQGKQKLKQVSKEANVLIIRETEDEKLTGRGIRSLSSIDCSDGTVYNTTGGQQVIVVEGDITGLDVDVIVNAANKDLVHSGGMAKVLINEGGKTIQTDCDRYAKTHGQLPECEVFCSGPGTLNCKVIVHAVGPIWQGGGNQEEDILCSCVASSLEATEQRGLSSIAIPALCTGIFGYPVDEATRVIAEAVRDYFQHNRSSCIQTVYLCDISDKTVSFFDKAGSKLFTNSHESGRKKILQRGQHETKQSANKKKQKPTAAPNTSDASKLYSVNMGNLVFKVYQGDITSVKVDGIVNGTNTDLDLSVDAVAKAIRTKGGKELDQQVYSQRQLIKKEGIAVTMSTNKSPKGLPCKFVIHIDMTDVNAASQDVGMFTVFSTKLKDKTKQVLDKAEELCLTTVALPALGTSANSYFPVSQTAEEMFKVVEKFSSKPGMHVKEVHVVIYQQSMVVSFMDGIKKCMTKIETDKGFFGNFLKFAGFGSGYNKRLKLSIHDRKLVGVQNKIPILQVPVYNEPTEIRFVIYARDKTAAENAMKLLEKSIEDENIERSVTAKIIKEFTPDQETEVKNLGSTGKVQVTLDKNGGVIKLRGLINNICHALDEANKIVQLAEHSKQLRRRQKLITNTVQWYYIDDDKGKKELQEYPSDVNLLLETAFNKQQKEESFYDRNDNKYIVDFNSYEEYPENDPTDTVPVLRKSKLLVQAFEPPPTWEFMDDKENIKIVRLESKDLEYQNVTKKFLATSGQQVEFVKIERVQNKTLYQQFIAKKQFMDATNPKTEQNERELWHGSSVDALDSICRYGFNRSYCGKKSTSLGAGVYFTVNVNYSLQDTYSIPDKNGHKRMFLCRVLTGEYTTGDSSMKVTPQKPNAGDSHILYDTVTNNVTSPIMFVIFNDSQALPEYIVTFKKK